MAMEVNYGVEITNKFALFLNEDEDPLDILRLEEENKLKKLDKKKTSSTEKDTKAKNKTNKADAGVEQKKAAVTTTGPKKDVKAPQTKGKPVQSESSTEKKPGKENDLPPRRREEGGFRPRPQSGTPRDGPQGEGFNRPERSGERPNRGFRPQRFDRGGFVERGERPEFGGERVEEGEGSRGGFRRGGPRGGGRGGRGGFRGGKREFDRHSGSDRSGVKPQDKRDGAGAHNWGTISDEIQEQLNANGSTEERATWAAQVEAAEAQPAAEGAKPEEVEAEAGADAEAQEQEQVLTLDEWKAQQETHKVKQEFNIRKPGEGCAADPQWKKMVALKKKENEEEEEEEEDDDEEDAHQGRGKKLLDIDIKFNTSVRRGGFGRGRGGRGRGGFAAAGAAPAAERIPRSQKQAQKAPNVADELDFPSLGAQ